MTLLRLNTVPTLEEFLKLPETKPAREYIDGKIYQKPMPQGKHSRLQSKLVSAINQAGEPNKLALAFTELRCTFAGRSIVPDLAVFEWQNIPLDANGQHGDWTWGGKHAGDRRKCKECKPFVAVPHRQIANKFTIAPDWIVEILSPDQPPNQVIRKIIFALNNGTKLGYLIDSDDKSVTVFQPSQLPEVKEKQDILPVLDVLQWQLKIEDMFSWLNFS